IACPLSDGRRCSLTLTMGKSITELSHLRLWMGSPVSPSLSEATTCWTYSAYLFTVRADRDFFILSTSGLTVMLLTLPKGVAPMAGRIHLLNAALTLLASLMGSRSRVTAQCK